MAANGRHLGWDGCFNVRDLGGYPTQEGGKTRLAAVVRSDNPHRLSQGGWSALTAYGVRTIVDLRDARELEEQSLHRNGVAWEWVPLLDFGDAEFWASLAGQDTLRFYTAALERYPDRFAAAVAAVGEAGEGAVLVHCQVGRDRTGLVCALLLSLAGVAAEDVAADYACSAERLRPLYESWLVSADPDERDRLLRENVSHAETMLAVLEHLGRRHGGAEGYLRAAGGSPDQLAAARARLIGA